MRIFDWTLMGGATIIPRSLKTTRNEKIFQDRPKFFLFLKSYLTLKYLLIIDFPKFDPLTRIPSGESIWGSRSKKDRLLNNQ
jgi:hypothetical protein